MDVQKSFIPYYAVIFTSVRTSFEEVYTKMSEKMIALAKEQPGFLGVESAWEGIGISVSYWRDEESISNWRNNIDHKLARKQGKEKWYESYRVRVAKVEREYTWERDT